MYTRPDDLSDDEVAAGVVRHWPIIAESIEHRPVGFGSHHWSLVDSGGARWFVTVDDLGLLARRREGSVDDAFARLRDALVTARALADRGLTFVIAPAPSTEGEACVRLDATHTIAVYPHVAGRTFEYGPYESAGDRQSVFDLVIALHAWTRAGLPVWCDDFTIPCRPRLDRAIAGADDAWTGGPYGRRAQSSIRANADHLARRVERHDALVHLAASEPERHVVTHGEPHPGNVIDTPTGWRLVDWDTVLVAPPERDLWLLGDTTPYESATGIMIRPELLELYRLWHDLADIALAVDMFSGPHADDADAATTWASIEAMVQQ